MAGFFRTTVLGGLLFILPFAVLIIVFGKVAKALRPPIDWLAGFVPFESLIGLKVPVLLTTLAIFAICFLAGLFGRTRAARRLVAMVETSLLSKIPGYSLLRNISDDIGGAHSESAQKVVLVRFDDAWQIGLKIEELTGGELVAVFIPDSPTPQTGTVLLVTPDRIQPTNIPMITAFSCLKDRGNGIGSILSGNKRR